MKLFGPYFSAVWMLCCCCLVYGRELQSKVLLPCLFEPALFGSDLTMNSSALWTQINETVDYILEIIVNGQISFWNNRHNRINGFRDAAASGNFSILIRDVQLSDLGLYRCQLYRDFNCSLGYKEIEISLAAVEFSLLSSWQLIAAGGGFLLLCLITVCVYYTWTKQQTVDESVNHRPHNCHDVDGGENAEITYASVVFKSHNCHDNEVPRNNDAVNGSASELISSETVVVYSTVKQRDRR